MPCLHLTVNGQPHDVEIDGSTMLAGVLREKLGLTGAKIGCEEAECGACTVLVDGQPVDSCIYPALKARGRCVETVEGLQGEMGQGQIHSGPYGDAHATFNIQPPNLQAGAEPTLHPLQEAFIQHGAVQCGFCIPGFLMMSKALLTHNPTPSDDDIKHALKDTYCRCGCYPRIIDAVKDAARTLRTGEPLQGPTLPPVKAPLSVVGQPVARPDAVAKVTGAARYTDDYVFPGMLHGATLRAGIPHARITRIDTTRAKALPGVHAVLTHADVPAAKNHGLIFPDWPVLCYDKVRYVGDAVAVVAADTRQIAQQALKLIEVDYEPLPVVDSPEAALADDAPLVHDGGNLLKHIKVRLGNVDAAFAQADLVVERTYRTPTYEQAFLEPECAIGLLEGDRVVIYVGSQIPFEDRRQVAHSLGLPEDKVRIVGTLIGGGFGGKEDIAAQIHVALLAQVTGRPVKVLYDRHESLIFHPKRHATVIHMKTGATRDGHIVAVEAKLLGDTGAYASLGDKVMTRATTHAAGPYAVPNVKIDCYAMYTNNPVAGAFRGFGVTQSCFAVESQMDIIAEKLGIDPVELRRKNALQIGSVTSTGQTLRESVGMLDSLDKVAADMTAPATPAGAVREGARVRAWGIACGYKNTGLGGGAPDRGGADVEVFEDGTAIVKSGAAEIGQGLNGVLAFVTAEELGLPAEAVHVLLSDTDLTPDGGPTTASRQTFVNGNAARLAARQVRNILASAAAERLDVSPDALVFSQGQVWVNGTLDGKSGVNGKHASVSLSEVARWARNEGRLPRARITYDAPQTQPLGTGGDMHFAFSYGAQAALVEVNQDTGEVEVLKLVTATDIGRVLNLLGLVGQIEGGAIMGLGNALTEEFIVEQGRVVTDRLSKYKMPGIKHTPEIVTHLVEHEVSSGPYGGKGVGEISSIPTTPAIINAIYNACGVRVYTLPVDQDKLLRAIHEGRDSIH